MIDWWNVFTNAIWLTGLAIALAVFSCADWYASNSGTDTRAAIRRSLRKPGFLLGIGLACLGAGLGVSSWWERMVWFVLAVFLLHESSNAYWAKKDEPTA